MSLSLRVSQLQQRKSFSKVLVLAAACLILFAGVLSFATLPSSNGHPAAQPEPTSRRPAGGMRKLLASGTHALAEGLISAGASLDPEAVIAHTPNKGFIRMALERTRTQLSEQVNQTEELQRFYEAELARLSHLLEREEELMTEVLGDDFKERLNKRHAAFA